MLRVIICIATEGFQGRFLYCPHLPFSTLKTKMKWYAFFFSFFLQFRFHDNYPISVTDIVSVAAVIKIRNRIIKEKSECLHSICHVLHQLHQCRANREKDPQCVMEMAKGNLGVVRCQLNHNSFWIWQLKKLEQWLFCGVRIGNKCSRMIECNVGQVAGNISFASRMSSP